MPHPSEDGPMSADPASMKPPPLLSRRRFKGSAGTAQADSSLNLENKNLKFEKRVLERLIEDQEAQLEVLARTLRDQSSELSILRRFNGSLSLESLENINNTISKALGGERKKHEDERKKQDEALQKIEQLEKVTLAVLEREMMRVRSAKSQHSEEGSQDDIPIALGRNFL